MPSEFCTRTTRSPTYEQPKNDWKFTLRPKMDAKHFWSFHYQMHKSEEYKPNLSRGILLLGQSGMAKTTSSLIISLGTPYIADCDNNLSGPHGYLKTNGFKGYAYDIIDIADDGTEVPPELRFERLSKCIKAASADPMIQTLIIDPLTKVQDYVCDDIMRQQGRKAMQLQDWGVFLNVMKRTITMMRSTRKLFIATAHLKPEKDEVGGFMKFFPALAGQIQHIIGALFSDVFICDVDERSGKHNYILRTMPSSLYAAKNSLGLPPVTTAEEVHKALEAQQ
jgi:AAA domain